MLIRNPKAFMRGLVLMASFIVVFVLFFMPIFPAQEEGGEKSNGLVFADHLFNTLSKGSSNFFDPTLANPRSVDAVADGLRGVTVDIEVPLRDSDTAHAAVQLLTAHGLQASASAVGVKMNGDLHAFMKGVVADSFSTFHNNLDEVSARHGGMDGRLVMRTYWALADGMVKPMQRAGQVREASAVNNIRSRAIEASYNFYGITPLRVVDNIPLVAGFLIFYVVYTMWYGFAIFELFEGVGLSMKKAAKSEV